MSSTFTEKMGFIRQVSDAIAKNAETLKNAGFDADFRLREQNAKNDNVATINANHDALESQLQIETENRRKAMRDAYVTASGNLDAMMGFLNKDSQTAKVLQTLRSKIRFGRREKKEESIAV